MMSTTGIFMCLTFLPFLSPGHGAGAPNPIGCNSEDHGISCCELNFTPGDNANGNKEMFIQPEIYRTSCIESCKDTYSKVTGVTESVKEKYSSGYGRNRNKCWCEFGDAKLDPSNQNYQTCVFNICSGPPTISPKFGSWICNSELTRCHLSCSAGYLPNNTTDLQCLDGLWSTDSSYFCEPSMFLITGGYGALDEAELITQTLNGEESTCQQTPPSLPKGLNGHTTFYYSLNKEVFLCGGELSESSCISIIPTASSWTNHSLPSPIGEDVRSVKDREEKEVIFIGGWDDNNMEYSTPKSLSLPMTSRPTLTAVPNLSYRGTSPCVALLRDSSFLILGGQHYDTILSNVIRYSFLDLTNTTLAPMSVHRVLHACATLNIDGGEFVVVSGGSTDGSPLHQLASSEIMDMKKNTWTQLKPLQEGRYAHKMVATGAGLLVFGGRGHICPQSGCDTFGRLQTIESLESINGSWVMKETRLEKHKTYFGMTEVPASFFQCTIAPDSDNEHAAEALQIPASNTSPMEVSNPEVCSGSFICCPHLTDGDNTSGTEKFIQESQYKDSFSSCTEACQVLQPFSNGVTQSKTQNYEGNGKPLCWCEFGEAVYNPSTGYQTCLFKIQEDDYDY